MPIEEHWRGIDEAPYHRELELAVVENGVAHALVFPCRRGAAGWIDAQTGAVIKIEPSHWRYWRQRT